MSSRATSLSIEPSRASVKYQNGRRLIRREALVAAMHAVTDKLMAELRERLTALVVDDPETAKNMASELAQSERRIKKFVAKMQPVVMN